MNYKMVFKVVGRLLQVEAALMLLPFAVSLYYRESPTLTVIYCAVIAALALTGSALTLAKVKTKSIYAREGFLIVALSWVMMSLFGALPFFISGAIPSFVDALFETVSGFTTTGSTILSNIEALPKSLLFWRAFTHWIGGMGIIVFVLAILPQNDMQSMHIMRAEVPGPTVGKLVSKTRVTARILYFIYSFFTLAETVALLCCKLSLFDSVTTAFATAGTGGFAIKNASIAAYDNIAAEIVITLFMLLFGVNFNLFYLIVIRQIKRVFKSEELWTYIGIFAVSTAVIAADIYPLVNSVGTALRQSGFQVASIVTTTGFVTADFTKWPTLSQFIIFMLTFCGACAGSTGGGLKVGRIMILVKAGIREMRRAINPRSVKCIKLDGAVIDKEIVSTTCVYFLIYMLVIAFSSIIVSLDNFDMITTLSSVVTCINNVGPGFGGVGPVENFAGLSVLSKLVLSADMLVGRLEIFPMIILFMPSVWKKNA
ncbi:MAG: TrkH family potassium uptake protein [Oscillospiraceae bacterium]|nr:TrkH family potassium uptake protein [Oscillospiraceae bacterium]